MGNKLTGNYNKDGEYITAKDACTYCEGTSFHMSRTKECGACDGTGKKIVQTQLEKVYRAKNNLPIRKNKQ